MKDPETLKKIITEAIEFNNLESLDGIAYQRNEKTPFTGWTKIYETSGQVSLIAGLGLFKNGKQNVVIYFHRNGQIKEEEHFKEGRKEGLWTYWYESGQKLDLDRLKNIQKAKLL